MSTAIEAITLLPPSEREYPSVELDDFVWLRRMRGFTSPTRNRHQMRRGRNTYRNMHGRDRQTLNDSKDDKWHLYREINGAGMLTHLHGFTRDLDLRITINGIEQIVVRNGSSRIIGMAWGEWYGANTDIAEGMYFVSTFGVDSPEYQRNFRKGGVYFETQLRIEYRNRHPNKSHTMCMDYLMESEII